MEDRLTGPFTEEEQKIMDLLVEAHRIFINLPKSHPNEMMDWVNGIHQTQYVLMARITRRDYPKLFYKVVKT